jgi:hypothetical protein
LRQSLIESFSFASERNCRKVHSRVFIVSQKTYIKQRFPIALVSYFYYNIYVIANKAKASVSVAKPNTLALASLFGEVAEWSDAADCKSAKGSTSFAGSNPALSGLIISPASICNYQQGRSLGIAPKAGFLRSLSFWTQMLEESKVQK